MIPLPASCHGRHLPFGARHRGSSSAANPIVVMETPKGTVKIELYPDKAPVTVKNFLDYVDAKFYDGTFFHRVIPTFMIQGGGFTPGLQEKPTNAPIKNESGNGLSQRTRHPGAMARTSDYPDKRHRPSSSSTSRTISSPSTRENSQDGAGYCVFGKVIEGMDVVDKIKMVETSSQGGQDNVPVDQAGVVIKSMRRADAK